MSPARVRRRREPAHLEQIPAWHELVPVMDAVPASEAQPGYGDLLHGLNADQLRAVTHGDGPMLVVGLQQIHGQMIHLPTRTSHRPDPQRLAARYGRFRAAS